MVVWQQDTELSGNLWVNSCFGTFSFCDVWNLDFVCDISALFVCEIRVVYVYLLSAKRAKVTRFSLDKLVINSLSV